MGSTNKRNASELTEVSVVNRISTTPRMRDKTAFMYVIEGECDILTENETLTLSEGMAVYISRYAAYAGVRFSDNLKLLSMKIGRSESEGISEKAGLYKVFSLRNVDGGEKIKSNIYDFFKMFYSTETETQGFALKGLAYMLIGVFFSRSSAEGTETKIEKNALERITPVLEYIKAHYNEEITVEQAAAILNLNPSYFCRLFKNATGKTFIHYINGYRIMLAQKELTKNGATVTQMVYEMGFSSYSYFNRIFKQFSGCSPTEYQRKYGTVKK